MSSIFLSLVGMKVERVTTHSTFLSFSPSVCTICLPIMCVFGLLLLNYAQYGVSNLYITAVTLCHCLLSVS